MHYFTAKRARQQLRAGLALKAVTGLRLDSCARLLFAGADQARSVDAKAWQAFNECVEQADIGDRPDVNAPDRVSVTASLADKGVVDAGFALCVEATLSVALLGKCTGLDKQRARVVTGAGRRWL